VSARRALISVHRKDGIVELARGLTARGFEIVSTGGTADELRKAKIKVTGVSEVTGFRRYWTAASRRCTPRSMGESSPAATIPPTARPSPTTTSLP